MCSSDLPEGAAAAARALLVELGALDAGGAITALGERMAKLGAHPRLSAMMLAAENPAQAARACDIAALLENRDPLRGGTDQPADIMLRLDALADPASHGADRNALHGIRQAARQYRARLGIRGEQQADEIGRAHV